MLRLDALISSLFAPIQFPKRFRRVQDASAAKWGQCGIVQRRLFSAASTRYSGREAAMAVAVCAMLASYVWQRTERPFMFMENP
jgi:hypothetical protein